MGAWGHGHFDNDSALDFLHDAENSANPKKIFDNTFNLLIESDYIDADDASAAIVAAAYVDSQINGTKYSELEETSALKVDTFADRNPSIDLADLQEKAAEALKKVLSDESELNELWAENEEDYPAWREGVTQLMQRLSPAK